jgi:signal transduction histidine kinase
MRTQLVIFGFIVLSFICADEKPLYAQTARIDLARELILKDGANPSFDHIILLLEEKNSFPDDTLKKYFHLLESVISKSASQTQQDQLEYFKVFLMHKENSFAYASAYCDSVIQKLKLEGRESVHLIKVLQIKASLLVRNGRYEEALTCYYDGLNIAVRLNNTEYKAASKLGVGWVYMEMEKLQEAMNWFRSAKGEISDLKILKKFTVLLQNMAATFNSLHQNDSALYYLLPSIEYAEEVENLRSLANGYAIHADILIDLKRIEEAEASLNKALAIRKKIGDMFYVLSDMYQLSLFYSNVKQCEKGIQIAKEGIVLASNMNISSKLLLLHEALASNYKSCDDKVGYIAELEHISHLKDSINTKVSASALAEMSAKYELEEKEQQIQEQEFLLTKRNYINIGSVVLLLLMVIIGLQYFRYYKHKQNVMARLAVVNARDEERNRIAAELHDNIGTQLGYISRRLDFVKEHVAASDGNSKLMIDEVNLSTRKTIADLRETIWALKKERINLRELSDRLKVFAQKQFSTLKNIDLILEENYESDVLFSSVDSLNVFRIIQEGIHNITQHADAKTVFLSFKSTKNGSWTIVLKDNGIGFDINKRPANHFGLEHMEQRAKEISATLIIETDEEKGTLISLSSKKGV